MKLKKVRNKILLILSFLIIIISLFILLCRFYKDYSFDKKNELQIESFLNEEIVIKEKEQKEDPNANTKGSSFSFDYIAVLEIPSINLKRGLVDPSSKYNNVDYNIQIIKGSSMPDIDKGNLILASHNGVGYIALFKNLSKLNINDSIYVYYNNIKYEYSLNNFYETQKNKQIKINRDNNKNTITLITCKRNSNDIQIVYIGYLKDKTIY